MKDGTPQKENGYTPIANEIMDQLVKFYIPGEQMKCLLKILRNTYGWSKKEDRISLSQFVEATGIKKPNIIRALNGLRKRNMIVIKDDNKVIPVYRFNKFYLTWKALSKKITLSKMIPTKASKAIITKTKYCPTSIEVELSKFLFNLILKRNSAHKKPDLQKWAVHIDRMIRIDKREPQIIKEVISWSQDDDFWQNNILATEKLRRQFDQLFLKMNSNGDGAGKTRLFEEARSILEFDGERNFLNFCKENNLKLEEARSWSS